MIRAPDLWPRVVFCCVGAPGGRKAAIGPCRGVCEQLLRAVILTDDLVVCLLLRGFRMAGEKRPLEYSATSSVSRRVEEMWPLIT